jgi:pilus assembly protein CpaB
MRSRGILMLFIAMIAGLAAVILAARWIQNQGGEKGSIAVANVDIELGGRISPEMIRMAEWPEGSKPAGSFNDPAKLQGRVVLVSIQRGEPLTDGRLAPIGTKGGLSAVVPEGKRAMTVRVNDVVGVAGFALPGTYVDVMVNTQDEGGQRGDRDHSISKIVLERILVLAVAQEADRDSTKPKVVNAVTLELTPKDAEFLDLARSVGTLSLVLRNQTDPKSVVVGGGATKSELLGLPKAEPIKVAASAPTPAPAVRRPAPLVAAALPVTSRNCVEVIRGLSKVTECF